MTAESFLDGKVVLHPGDCLAVLDTLAENSHDAGVCDPPYHLASIVKRFGKPGSAEAKDYSGERDGATGAYSRAARGFMGQTWDGGDIAFRPETWAKVLRVLKPGAHLVAFAAPKNVGLLQVAIEAAGFETRDCILDLIDLDPMLAAFVGSLNDEQRGALFRLIDEGGTGGLLAWLFGSGFPKSHAVSLEYERALCDRREIKGRHEWVYKSDGEIMARSPPFRDARAQVWAGYGTALKPAFEPIMLARKPLESGLTVAENCLKWGTGALNIDACRIDGVKPQVTQGINSNATSFNVTKERRTSGEPSEGRWPANVMHDGSAAVTDNFSNLPAKNARGGRIGNAGGGNVPIVPAGRARPGDPGLDDGGSSARFFYTAKADADDRLGSKHPTVKPLDIMQYLVRLVTRPGQTVLDLFAGTGTTGEAAFCEGRRAVLIEREPQYQADIRRRMRLALGGTEERSRESIKASGKAEAIDTLPLFGGIDATTPPTPVGRSMECSPMNRPSGVEA